MCVPSVRGHECDSGCRHTQSIHGDNGSGVGASHQTGWTGLVAPLLDLFARVDAKSLLESERGDVMARIIREQVGGQTTGGG